MVAIAEAVRQLTHTEKEEVAPYGKDWGCSVDWIVRGDMGQEF
jgi:hypothetical protein